VSTLSNMRQAYSFLGQNSLRPLPRTNSVKLRALSQVDVLFVTVSFEARSLARKRRNVGTTFTSNVTFLTSIRAGGNIKS
jgi:hypothetical protein